MGCGGTAPRSGHFTFGEISAGTHLTGVSVGVTAGLGVLEKIIVTPL